MSAHDVAAELRRRLPGVPLKKLHKLLYYCQGHHLATFDASMFSETISAFDMGPVVAQLWWTERNDQAPEPRRIDDEATLNTIGYVVSRYGALSGLDLEHLTHSEDPWLIADRNRRPGESARIDPEWMRDFFRSSSNHDDEELTLDSAELIAWLEQSSESTSFERRPDSREELLARLAARA